MRKPIKRPITLKKDYLYELKDGSWAIFLYFGWRTGKAVFRRQRRIGHFYVKYWNRNVVRRIRKKTERE